MLKITTMNTPQVELDGRLVTFPFKRADALLYYLAVERAATRQELIALLWEDCDETTGLKNLRNTLYNLKKVLGGEFLISPQKSMIMVNPDWEFDCDYDRFVRRGDRTAYTGTFLQGFAVKHAFAFEEWMLRTADRLRSRYLSQLTQEMEQAKLAGEYREMIRLAREFLAEEPLHEPAVVLLMEGYLGLQQYSRAVDAYTALKEQLGEELGTDPLDTTKELYYRILNQWDQGTGREHPPLPVGREEIYHTLCGEFLPLSRGEAGCNMLLTGDAGVGKSELIDFYLRWGTEDSFQIVRHSCLRSELNLNLVAWEPVVLTLWEIAKREELLLPVRVTSLLERVFRLSGGNRSMEDREFRQFDRELAACIRTLIRAVAKERPVLLVLEGLQWMDRESLLLLRSLTETSEPVEHMGILMTCRDDHPFYQLSELNRDPHIVRRRLQPLNRDQVRELLAEELGEEEADRTAEEFYRETGGNLSLLHVLISRRREEGAEPENSRSVLTGSLGSLTGPARSAAEILAVYSRELSGRQLLSFMGGDERAVSSALATLRREGLVEELQGENDWFYHFTFPQFREMVYEQITLSERRHLHGKIAREMLERWTPNTRPDLMEIAEQFELAGDMKNSLECSIRGLAWKCVGIYIPMVTTAFSRKMGPVRHMEEPAGQPDLDSILEEVARAQRKFTSMKAAEPGADWTYCESLLLEIFGCAEIFRGEVSQGIHRLGNISGMGGYRNREQRLRVCYRLAALAVDIQAVDMAERYVTTGRRLLKRDADLLEMAAFERLQGCCFCLREIYDKAAYYHMEAIDILEKMDRNEGVALQLALAYSDYARVCRQVNGYAEASAYFKKAWNILRGEPKAGTLWFYVHYARTVLVLEDHARARELFETACRTGNMSGEIYGRAAAEGYLALLLAEEDELDAAAEHLKRATEYHRRNHSPLEGGIICYISMKLRARLDRENLGSTPLGELLPLAPEEYARRGIRILDGLPNVNEGKLMAKALREGIGARQSYRANELYSRNNRFMGE